ncbi:Uncharacterised protein [Mycobacteroides abscessus subsp. abscessus]|nr:Uncharacterised protein [Mycobacteroides abscessus subsp. abscessus]
MSASSSSRAASLAVASSGKRSTTSVTAVVSGAGRVSPAGSGSSAPLAAKPVTSFRLSSTGLDTLARKSSACSLSVSTVLPRPNFSDGSMVTVGTTASDMRMPSSSAPLPAEFWS